MKRVRLLLIALVVLTAMPVVWAGPVDDSRAVARTFLGKWRDADATGARALIHADSAIDAETMATLAIALTIDSFTVGEARKDAEREVVRVRATAKGEIDMDALIDHYVRNSEDAVALRDAGYDDDEIREFLQAMRGVYEAELREEAADTLYAAGGFDIVCAPDADGKWKVLQLEKVSASE